MYLVYACVVPWPPIYHSYSSLVSLKLPYIQKSVDGVLKQKEIPTHFCGASDRTWEEYKNFDTLGGDTQGESGRDARLMMRNSTFPLYCTTIL